MALGATGSSADDGSSPSTGVRGLKHLSAAKQRRLDTLMGKNNEGVLNKTEMEELKALVRETQQLALENAQRLASQK